jgi:transposase
MSHYGRITKEGDPEMRRLLVQAAHALLRTKADSELKEWALLLAERRGKGKAVVALARKLAVLMHHLWVTGEVYQAFPNSEAVKVA